MSKTKTKVVRRQRLGRTKGNRGQCAWHSKSRSAQLLTQAIERIPDGRRLDTMAHHENKTWDAYTGKFLRKR